MSDEGKSFFKKFIYDSDEKPSASTAPSVPLPAAIPTSHPVPYVAARPAVDIAVRQKLEASLTEAAPAGYVAIVDIISTLADSIPDESSRYRAAMKLAARQGHSLDHLLGDMDKCIGILEAKGREFESETQKQIDRKIGARQSEIQRIDTDILEKQKLIQQLQAEVSTLSEQRAVEAAAMTMETAKITSVRDSFVGAYESVHTQLMEQRSKIAMHGKAVLS